MPDNRGIRALSVVDADVLLAAIRFAVIYASWPGSISAPSNLYVHLVRGLLTTGARGLRRCEMVMQDKSPLAYRNDWSSSVHRAILAAPSLSVS
jgi:hypothetical protein